MKSKCQKTEQDLKEKCLRKTFFPSTPPLPLPPTNQPTAALSGASIVKFASEHQRSPFYTVKADSAQITLDYSFTLAANSEFMPTKLELVKLGNIFFASNFVSL